MLGKITRNNSDEACRGGKDQGELESSTYPFCQLPACQFLGSFADHSTRISHIFFMVVEDRGYLIPLEVYFNWH